MKKFNYILTLSVLAINLNLPLFAQNEGFSAVNPRVVTGGTLRDGKQIALTKSTSPKQFLQSPLTTDEVEAASWAKQISSNKSNLAVVMVERGKIIYQSYNTPSNENSPLLSMSMSKTLTAQVIGQMHCAGLIPTLDAKAKTYSTLLEGTIYGEASVRNLLTMSSGVATPSAAGELRPNAWRDITTGAYALKDYVRDYGTNDAGATQAKSGGRFVYSNTDTVSLSFVADGRGGFLNNFSKLIWEKVKTEADGYWLVDKDQSAVSYAGFSATARDWARLALFGLDQLKNGESCIRKFMHESTAPQIANNGPTGKAFASYGYQTWVGNFGPRSSYWYVGYGGQRIGIDPEKERIIVVFSSKEDYMQDVYKIFSRWQRH